MRRTAWLGFGLVIAIGGAACGSSGGGGDDDDPPFSAIEVEPSNATFTVELGGSATQVYTVYGVAGDDRVDITADCALSVDPAFGGFADATLTVAPHGGKTSITAACGAASGTALLTVNLRGTIIEPGAPPGSPGIFEGATAGTDPLRSPLIEYPLDGAVSPRNIPSVEVQWTAAGNDLFHVALRSDYVAVDIYTTAVEALMTPADWTQLVGSAAGANLRFTVEGLLQADPATRHASAPVDVTVTHDDIDQTAIYYWASSQGQILTQVFGDPDPPTQVAGDCTSCHSVSRDGNRIGYSRCVGNDCNNLFVGFLKYDPMTSTWVETVNANAMATRASYTTFAPVGNPFPSDSQALAMVSLSTGHLGLMDPDTGAAVPSNAADASGAGSALMADWSPDGSSVVFVQTPTPGQWIDLDDGRIATMSYAYANGSHTFGAPQLITPTPVTLPSGTYDNFFFPSFSPDGELIVFNAARSGWRNFTDAHIPGQRLMLADAAGTWVQDLTALNGGDVSLDITWPHWAPSISDEYYWIVFSSERDYGHRSTRATGAPCVGNGVLQCKQIWLAAISRARLEQGGVDPSAAPMWLPGQSPTANNISPYWSLPASVD